MEPTADWERIATIVEAPAFIRDWLDRFYDAHEAGLLLALGDGPRSRTDLGVVLELADDRLNDLLARAHRRAVVDFEGDAVRAASFYERSEIWALFKGWADLPRDVHQALADWWLDDYTESVREPLLKLRDGHPEPGRDADYAYLLLEEAEDLVRRTEHIYLWPCDCRTLMGACDKSIYNCLRFHNDRDLGWEISHERAIEILREADAEGLTHTDYVGFGGYTDPHAICNCCTDCCQPHLAAERLGVGDIWPRRRHVARLLPESCTLCGTCTQRCPFGALSIASGPDGERLLLAEETCRGCGLCATGCPEAAIAMEARAAAG
jgi:ferredoxin